MSDRPIEYAMTHRIGSGGATERCQRPAAIREIADRVRRWKGEAETCKSCLSLPAVTLRTGWALCSRCRDNRFAPASIDRVGVSPYVERQDDEASGVQLRGLSIVFNVKSEFLGFFEIIRPAAVDRTFSERIDVRSLWSHNPDFTIGRMTAGTLRAKKVTRGLSVEIDPPRWAHGHVESVKRRDIVGQSFGFIVIEDDWHLEDGEAVREVLDAEIIEVSPVSFPAYPATTLKAVDSSDRSEWYREQMTKERLRLVR